MMLAADASGERFIASPGKTAFCPTCGSEVIAKCGEVKCWHWAHKSLKECDIWSEPESEWHYSWKQLAGLENTEIVISNSAGDVHRADIRIKGRVIELQHSPLSTREVRERETFYGNMIWLIDAKNIGEFGFSKWRSAKGKEYFTIKNIKRAWVMSITKPTFFHFTCLHFSTIHEWKETHYGWRPSSQEIDPETYRDVVVKWTDQKFARIIPKERFCSTYFSGGHR